MRFRATFSAGVYAFFISACVGCGGGGAGSAPVEGKVTLDGKPLSGASVVFAKTRVTSPGPFVAETDADGRYKLGPVGSPGTGAAPGEYLIQITTVKVEVPEGAPTPPNTPREIVPIAYRDGSTRYTVPEGGKTDANFDIKSR